ncbi:TlpA family protein disulfide reductase [Parablautia muri]|uniref:TlpA family protein disulfide reductase n=1 Tax=Parablautia muri TaxID=2320879 RepID=A0A9X5BE64_9FIRM|nr:TlpA disulfide reductase family protein [Parablautia muri]NBJ92045.1 TlpA family protein disulfide reductase [Parablautia muri]
MKKSDNKRLFVLLILAILLTGCSNSSQAEPENNVEAESEMETEFQSETETEGESASSQIVFEGQDIEGNPVSSAIFSSSKLTMVNVWATYCNPCLSEMPVLGELAGEYEPDQFQIIGVISDVLEGGDQKAIDLAANLIEQTGANYTHLLLNQSIFHALLTDVTAVPTTFFIDESGTIVDIAIGAMDKSAWEEKINGLLQES